MKLSTKNTYHERILSALLHIQKNLDDELSLESLAAMTHFSPIHFHRIFKGMIGESVIEHVRRIRMERSAHHLANGGSVTDEAFNAGYETVESFSRAFKKMFGCPPSKYLERHWEELYTRIPGEVHYLPDSARSGYIITFSKETEMDVTIKQIDPMRVAFVRHIGPYIECAKAWNTVCDWAQKNGVFNGEFKTIGICYDDPQVTPADKIRYDACLTVADTVEGEGEVGIQTIEGGEYAMVLHKGPYENLEKTYATLMGKWLPESGREYGGGVDFELYVNSPDQTPPEELLTEVYMPLKPLK